MQYAQRHNPETVAVLIVLAGLSSASSIDCEEGNNQPNEGQDAWRLDLHGLRTYRLHTNG
jgi:hypothetical protein